MLDLPLYLDMGNKKYIQKLGWETSCKVATSQNHEEHLGQY